MALIECYECNKQVSDSAAACPNCGAPVKKKVSEGYIPPKVNTPVAPPARKVSILLIIGIAVFPYVFVWFLLRKGHSGLARAIGFGWLAFCIYMPYMNAPNKSVSTTSTSSSSTGPSEYEKKEIARREEMERLNALPLVSAAQIAQAYEENTVAADQMFKDKWFRVSGVVDSINTDFLGKPYITLKGGVNQFMEPQFGFDKDQASIVAGIRKGSKVVLACEGHGDVAKTPMSRSCKLM
ncbi:OB-fold putative lipoprotein [Pseudomonas sp. LA21]|uniref:OB-fold putative lipoprotein n=1 Tax=Pseudomonas sp. LA21 TaxID=2893373 RepID=UPI001FB6DF82|nr:OB-fold putative lipoprotein [Pseudomonas sp. LA21]MCJ1886086.1 OB-fold putative lipoprotein [Pseudomonas sp. LA21]